MSDKKGDFDIEVGGYQVKFDLNCFTRKEWRHMLHIDTPESECDILMARASGLTENQIEVLSNIEWRLLWRAFLMKNREPLSDPN